MSRQYRSDSMEIAIVSLSITDPSYNSGGIRIVTEYMKSWVESGNRVTLLTSKEGIHAYTRTGAINGAPNLRTIVTKGGPMPFGHKPRTLLAWVFRSIVGTVRLIPTAASVRNCVVFSSLDLPPDIMPALFCKLVLNKKWMSTVYHFLPPPDSRPGSRILNAILYLLDYFDSLLCKFADFIVVESSRQKSEVIRRLHINPDRVVISSGGIRPLQVDSIRPIKDGYDALFVSRLHPAKGVFDLVRIWKEVVKLKEDAKLGVIGSAPDSGVLVKLRKQIIEAGLETKIFLLGPVSEEVKYSLMKSSKVLVHPSYEDGVPLVFYEALYCGMQVATFDLPTYADIAPYITSSQLGDVRDLAKVVVSLIPSPREVSSSKAMVRKHDWDVLSADLLRYVAGERC